MPISGCWPSTPTPLALLKASQQPPAGVASKERPVSPQLRYVRKSNEALSLTLPPKPSRQRQVGLLHATPMTLPHERSFAASLRSSPPPSPSLSPIKMRTPVKASVKQPSARQPVKRTLYSDADASRDMALLTSAEKDLGISIQLNRKRLIDAHLSQMEGVHTQIKSLIQELKNTDRTDPEKTRTFRRRVNDQHGLVRSYLSMISETYVLGTQQRQATQKTRGVRNNAATVASFEKEMSASVRLARVAIRQREAAALRQQGREMLAVTKGTQENVFHIAGANPMPTISEDRDQETITPIRDAVADFHENWERKETHETGSDNDIGYRSQDSQDSLSPTDILDVKYQLLPAWPREGLKSEPAPYVDPQEKHVALADEQRMVGIHAVENDAVPKQKPNQKPVSTVPPRNGRGRRLWASGTSTARSLPIPDDAIRVMHLSSRVDSPSSEEAM